MNTNEDKRTENVEAQTEEKKVVRLAVSPHVCLRCD